MLVTNDGLHTWPQEVYHLEIQIQDRINGNTAVVDIKKKVPLPHLRVSIVSQIETH